MIPFVDLTRQYFSIKREIDDAIFRVLESGRFILGTQVRMFEEEFASYVGMKFGVGVGSGTDALYLALKALGIGERDEVITPSFTFVSTVDAIVRNGAKPVFAEIDPDTYTISVESIKKLVTHRTKAVIPVHLYGHPVDMGPIMELSERYGFHVVEDAAQAHGAVYKDRKVGSFGVASCFSFYPSKNLGAYGDGGMVLTNDEEYAEKLKSLREYGQRRKYVHEFVGLNSRLDELQASILRVKLKYLDKWNRDRRKNAKLYIELLNDMGKEVKLPTERSYAKHVYHIFVIQISDRDSLRRHLASHNIETVVHYPIPVHLQKAYRSVESDSGILPNTEICANRVLSLPMFPELTESEIEYVVYAIRKFYQR